MPKKISKIGYRRKTETDPIVRASAALGRLKKATEKMDEKGVAKVKEKTLNILQGSIDELNKNIEPTVKCLKLCVQIKDEKSVLQVFNLSRKPDKEKIRGFIQRVEGFTRGERLYLHGVLRRNASYFDGTLTTQVQALYQAEKYQLCLNLISKWLRKIQGDDFLFAYQGQCLYHLGKYGDAIVSLNRAMEIDAGVFAWWVFRGDCYSALEQYDRAIRDYMVSLTLDAKNWATYDKCARALFLSGQTDKAIEYEEYAVKKDHSPEATLVLMQMFKDTGQRTRAQILGTRSMKRFPTDARFQKFLDEL